MGHPALKLMLLLSLLTVGMTAGGCEDTFKNMNLPSLESAPEKMGAPKR